ncbi:MAG: hypothetical protein BroJett018_29840 [Chloroflexota bacterium]|nr:MAG: hypothetical protein BroJett018_29840 [Chloroflexota bacterium]
MNRRILIFGFVLAFLVSFSPTSAQDAPSMFRMGYVGDNITLDSLRLIDGAQSYDFGAHPANLMTDYVSVNPGEVRIEYVVTGESLSDSLIVEAGQQYSFIKTAFDQPPLVINETQLRTELNAAPSDAITLLVGDRAVIDSFELRHEDGSTTGLDALNPVHHDGYSAYLQDTLTLGNLTVNAGVRLDASEDAATHDFEMFNLPATNVLVNVAAPSVVSYSTLLTVADWLDALNQGPEPSFTFTQFLNTATIGGFAPALVDCQDYMWLVWTDEAFNALTPEQQAAVSGASAAQVMDSSVLTQSLTAPWLLPPNSTTRGGLPIEFANPFSADSASIPAGDDTLSGNVHVTISTTGGGVQNVIHVIDTVPFGEPRRFYLGARLRF